MQRGRGGNEWTRRLNNRRHDDQQFLVQFLRRTVGVETIHKIHSKIKGREGEKQQKTRSDRGITTKNRNRNRDTGKDKEAKDKSEKKKGKQTDDKRKIREKYKENY